MTHSIATNQLSALILSGGRGSRMGGLDKGLVDLEHQGMIAHVIERIAPQVDQLMISANRSHSDYQQFNLPVLTDTLPDFQGPLAGIAAGLSHSPSEWLLVVPCDSPRPPADLADRLIQATLRDQKLAAIVHDGSHFQPAFNLLNRQLLPSLEQYLEQGGRKLGQWLHQQAPAIADFSDQPDSFINLNTHDQLHGFIQSGSRA